VYPFPLVFLSNFVPKTAVTDSHPARHVAVATR